MQIEAHLCKWGRATFWLVGRGRRNAVFGWRWRCHCNQCHVTCCKHSINPSISCWLTNQLTMSRWLVTRPRWSFSSLIPCRYEKKTWPYLITVKGNVTFVIWFFIDWFVLNELTWLEKWKTVAICQRWADILGFTFKISIDEYSNVLVQIKLFDLVSNLSVGGLLSVQTAPRFTFHSFSSEVFPLEYSNFWLEKFAKIFQQLCNNFFKFYRFNNWIECYKKMSKLEDYWAFKRLHVSHFTNF